MIFALAGLWTACDDDDDESPSDTSDPNAALKSAIVENYADIVYQNYEDALTSAQTLDAAITEFINNPTEDNLDDAKDAWLEAREWYGQSEAFRFSEGPIDAEEGPEGLLNAWPLDENYIDYVLDENGDVVNDGIINDLSTYPDLDGDLLESLNEVDGDANISIGYHAVEFLLWGQDDTDPSLLTEGARPATDYDINSSATNQGRRAQYLDITMDLLLGHLQLMVDAWDPNMSGNYRSEFLGTAANTNLRNVLTGIGIFSKGELAGERMFVAINEVNQEQEHSCFSDNTHRDIFTNAQGIRNIYTGSYQTLAGTTIQGSSIQELIGIVNSDLQAEMDALSQATIDECQVISDMAPFDALLASEVVDGNTPIITAVTSLQAQGDKIAEVADALGFTISVELPE